MIDPSVTQFYTKNPEERYIDTYETQHGDRLDKLVEHYRLGDLRGRVADVGGGLGFLGRRLSSEVDYWVFDGAEHPVEKRVCRGTWVKADIQRDPFGETFSQSGDTPQDWYRKTPQFDASFCLETLEHLSDCYHCLCQIKAMTKRDAPIWVSIPTETVWHNTPMPGLLWPRQNWEEFLGQLALPILDYWLYEPAPGKGWPAYHYMTRNADWREARMRYPKSEPKFVGKTPIEYSNL